MPALMQFLIVVLAAWLARQQEAFLEYLKAENRMLKARLGHRRIIFSDAERRLLARHAKAVGRKKLFELDPIVSPDTLLRWHRQLIAMKWTFLRKGPGRPRVMGTIEALVVRMASENPRWGTRASRARFPILDTRSPVERSRTSCGVKGSSLHRRGARVRPGRCFSRRTGAASSPPTLSPSRSGSYTD